MSLVRADDLPDGPVGRDVLQDRDQIVLGEAPGRGREPEGLVDPVAAQTYWISARHRTWVDSLPDILLPTVVEVADQRTTKMLPFDKAKIYPYAYWHSYAQRHADAGVPIDALRVWMDHRQLDTTQRY